MVLALKQRAGSEDIAFSVNRVPRSPPVELETRDGSVYATSMPTDYRPISPDDIRHASDSDPVCIVAILTHHHQVLGWGVLDEGHQSAPSFDENVFLLPLMRRNDSSKLRRSLPSCQTHGPEHWILLLRRLDASNAWYERIGIGKTFGMLFEDEAPQTVQLR